MRRFTKPFTVEIRRNGRQSEASSISLQPSWPDLDPEPASPTWEPQAAEPAPSAPAGRILPALDAADPTALPEVIVKPRRKRRPVAAATLEWIGERSESHDVDDFVVDPPTVARSGASRPQVGPARARVRAARSDFPPGERWKVRLPAIVRAKRRRAPAVV